MVLGPVHIDNVQWGVGWCLMGAQVEDPLADGFEGRNVGIVSVTLADGLVPFTVLLLRKIEQDIVSGKDHGDRSGGGIDGSRRRDEGDVTQAERVGIPAGVGVFSWS